jgi:hypothetical protein
LDFAQVFQRQISFVTSGGGCPVDISELSACVCIPSRPRKGRIRVHGSGHGTVEREGERLISWLKRRGKKEE